MNRFNFLAVWKNIFATFSGSIVTLPAGSCVTVFVVVGWGNSGYKYIPAKCYWKVKKRAKVTRVQLRFDF